MIVSANFIVIDHRANKTMRFHYLGIVTCAKLHFIYSCSIGI